MRIVIGCDDNGCQLKDTIGQLLAERKHEVHDLEGPGPYYEVAVEAAKRVSAGEADRAILVCGTGMGMAIVANKVRGVYAAVCESAESARKSRSINNSNVLTLGQLRTTPEEARQIVEGWLDTSFTEGFGPELQEWLQNSLKVIGDLEAREFG